MNKIIHYNAETEAAIATMHSRDAIGASANAMVVTTGC